MSHLRTLLTLSTLLMMLVGCESYDEQMTRLALESTEQQARQNEKMPRLNREVTEGNRRLTEASAAARQENLVMQHDLQPNAANWRLIAKHFRPSCAKNPCG